jgi:hypothetical protein
LLVDAIKGNDRRLKLTEDALLTLGMRRWLEDLKHPVFRKAWSKRTLAKDRVHRYQRNIELQMYKNLSDALIMAGCYYDALTISIDAMKEFPEDLDLKAISKEAGMLMSEKMRAEPPAGIPADELQATMRGGQVRFITYPWLGKGNLVRDRATMDSLIDSLKKKTFSCALRQRSTQGEAYGMFATRGIKSGDRVLVDPPRYSASTMELCCPTCAVSLQDLNTGRLASDTIMAPCCQTAFCTEACRDQALRTFHVPLCGADLSHIDKASNHLTASKLLYELVQAKVFACIIHEDNPNPLACRVIGDIHPHHDSGYIHLDFEKSYVLPLQTLSSLHIDVFADLRFDTWVLHTIEARLANNARQTTFRDATVSALNEHQPFFNHSCEPNMRQETADTDMSTVWYFASKDIREGEELCISYLDEDFFYRADVTTRQELLRGWFAANCWCTRCARERER